MHVQYTLACHAYIWLKTPVEEAENKSGPPLSTRERIVYVYFTLSRLISTRKVYIYIYRVSSVSGRVI